MTATVPFIQETFNRFNALCFGGVLPAVPITLSKAGTFLGKMEYSRSGCRMKISSSFDLPQDGLEDVVIHEMIHYYISYRNLRDSSAHGETFRRIMDTINCEYGRNIRVRYRCDPQQNLVRGVNGRIRKHFICVSTFSDGKIGVTVCVSGKVPELSRSLPRHYNLTKMEWYVSLDPFFNRFPRAYTPKIYRITMEELSAHLDLCSKNQ